MTMQNHPRMIAPPTASGFTLVELLVVLSLMGLLSVALMGGLQFGARAWETNTRNVDEQGEVRTVHGFLRQQLGQVTRPASFGTQRTDPAPPAFLGEPDELRFAGTLPAHRAVGGYHVFRLFLRQSGQRKDLVLRWQRYSPGISRDAFDNPENEAVLLRDIRAATFSFIEAGRDIDATTWTDRWSRDDQLPTLIRLRVEFPDQDRRSWPDLIVHPRVGG